MGLTALLVEIRRWNWTWPPPGTDPAQTLYEYCTAAPDSREKEILLWLALAIIHGDDGDIDENQVWALDQEALALLDALIERTIH